MEKMIPITRDLHIPARELTFTFSRSSKPGGQNVNKVSTRVTLWFDLAGSPSLSQEEKDRILNQLGGRISKKGQLRVVCYRHRTQAANRTGAVERFLSLLQDALKERTPRKKTGMPRVAKERRLASKKHRSILKQTRKSKISRQD